MVAAERGRIGGPGALMLAECVMLVKLLDLRQRLAKIRLRVVDEAVDERDIIMRFAISHQNLRKCHS
jgi:hypothetical protein